MDKQRRNKSFSRKAISRRNLKKIKSHFNLLLRQPNISIPNDYLEPLPAKLPRIEKKLDNDTENNNDKPSTSHHNIIDQSVVDNIIHNRESIYSRVGNSRKTDDNVNNANYDNHQNLIFQNRSDDNENVDARLDNCVVTNNSLPFNVSINFNSNIFITPNINTTIKDHLLSVVALSLRHHLSYDAILDIFRCMNMLYGTVELPTTKQALWRALGRNDAQITKYFYCRQCEDFLGEKSSDSNKLQQLCCCGACGPTKSKAQEGYFLYYSITAQLQQLLTLPNIIDALKYKFQRQKCNSEAVEDIYDGTEYKNLSSNGILKDWYNLSLTINTDGCQVANSSNTSAWPIFAQINELPPHLRKKHMLLVAIYVDKKHPLMNNFMRPLVDELRQLYQKGVTWKSPEGVEMNSKIIVTMGCFDSPARSAVTRFKQHNGYYSCLYCYIKGKCVLRKKIVFPVQQNFRRLRTQLDIERDMCKASEIGRPVRGIKGVSSFATLPKFDISTGVVIDSMHAVYLGVVKHHMTLLLTRTKAPYYIGSPNSRKIIDKCLLSIKPPSRRSRKPRSISTYKQWKASEWRNWLDYAPVCLEDVLDEKYVNHIALLSEAMHYLNSDSITESELECAERLLKKYVQLFQEYFDIISMNSNLHSLTHIVRCVRNWGPSWGHSAVVYEAWNKKLLDKLTSPHCRAEQIMTRFIMEKFITASSSADNVSVETRNYIKKVLKIPVMNDDIHSQPKIYGQGKSIIRLPTFKESLALISAGFSPETITYYKKMTINKVKYSCQNDEADVKYCDSVIYDGKGRYGIIQSIIMFNHGNLSVRGLLMLIYDEEGGAFQTQHIKRVKISENLVFVHENCRIKPACLMKSSDKTYVVKLSNCWETD